MPHLLAALHHGTGVVAGQLAVAAKSNELPALPVLLAQLDLEDVVRARPGLGRPVGRQHRFTPTSTAWTPGRSS